MTEQEILQIIQIDQLNMSKYFSDTGNNFDVELRKSGIKSELESGAVFILVKKNEQIVGYVEYLEKENKKLTIKSAQIHPIRYNPLTLRRFITGIYSRFKGSFEDYDIISAAHRTNRKSISLHKKLGFSEYESGKHQITYRCKGSEIINKLETYIKITTTLRSRAFSTQ
ncbi:MAG: hypothetical protein KJP07_06255 [Desulfatitalea sp.]|nr:hypothetical protein [Desulfatitalea sp.]